MRTLIPIVLLGISNSTPCLAQEHFSNYKNEEYWVQPVAELNTVHLEFSPVYFDGGLVFTSNREAGSGLGKRPDYLTGEICTALLFSAFRADGSLSSPVLFSKNLSSNFHDGPACFSKNGQVLFFNRNVPVNKNQHEQTQLVKNSHELNLKIYSASKAGDHWQEAGAIELYGGSNSSDLHPSLSADGQHLFFASDRPGGFGGMDLYRSSFHNGQWGFPVNLGPAVNTPGNEVFPFAFDDGTLYFASDARGGFGGLDIYKCIHNADFSSAALANLGKPINSDADDFGFVAAPSGKEGFFTSNRKGGQGSDDLYRFMKINHGETARQSPSQAADAKGMVVKGKVFQQGNLRPLPGAELTLANLCSGNLKNIIADAKGFFSFQADCQCDYMLRAAVNGFYHLDKMVTTSELDCQNTDNGSGINLDLPLIPSTGLASHPTLKEDSFRDMFESGFLIELGGIYYDFDQFKLLPQSMAELDKVVELMLRQPDLFVQVRSHTDSRGDDEYNHYLSSNRANAVAAYLVLNGIEVNRVSAKGFGEEQPVNGCTDGTECTEEEHQLNRRTELKLFKK